jgi:hypothetical protein
MTAPQNDFPGFQNIMGSPEKIGNKPIEPCNLEEFIQMVEQDKKVLPLLVKYVVFKRIETGMKLVVISKRNKVAINRLNRNFYTHVDFFVSYYRKELPTMICELDYYFIAEKKERYLVDNLWIEIDKGDYILKLGRIIEVYK